MKCFNHQEKDSLGICKNCNKGLCMECAIDNGHGLACKNLCEQAVKEINEMIHRSKVVYQKTSKRSAIFCALLGAFFIIYSLFIDSVMTSFLIPIGIIFFIAMFFNLRAGRTLNSKEKR